MTIKKPIALIIAACAACLTFALIGCAQPQLDSSAEETATSPSQYMTEMNRTVDLLKEDLDAFSEAVANEDISGMKAKAEVAFSVIDDLSELEAPEQLTDLKTKYVKGAQDLKTALSDYITLYEEVDNSTKADPFNFSSYDDRVAAIQRTYDSGIAKLEEADNQATEM